MAGTCGKKKNTGEQFADEPPAAEAPTAVEVSVNPSDVKKKKRGVASKARSFLPLLKFSPIVVLAILSYVLLSTGAWAYFLSQFMDLRGLDTQVDRLEEQVDRMEVENDRLEDSVQELSTQNDRLEDQVVELQNATEELGDEIDRLSDETDKLESQIDRLEDEKEFLGNLTEELSEENEALNQSVVIFQAENEKLNESNMLFQEQNEQLTESLTEANDLIIELNETIDELSITVENITQINEDLNISLEDALELNADLDEQVNNLTDANEALNATNQDLAEQIANLTAENKELEALLDDLRDLMQWLNETSGDFNESLQEIADELAAQVQENREILLTHTQQTYSEYRSPTDFNCAYGNRFGNQLPWGTEFSLPIEPNGGDYDVVIAYSDVMVLSPVCANLTDFELFLSTDDEVGYQPSGVMPPRDISSNQLLGGQMKYTAALMDYYFPNPGEDGLTLDDWIVANYTCDNLPPDQRFVYGASRSTISVI